MIYVIPFVIPSLNELAPLSQSVSEICGSMACALSTLQTLNLQENQDKILSIAIDYERKKKQISAYVESDYFPYLEGSQHR